MDERFISEIDKYELLKADVEFSITPEEVGRLRDFNLSRAVIGQDRALEALRTGLGISIQGYNIFIMGSPGTGRRTALFELLKEMPRENLCLEDILYVYNFENPLQPEALSFKAGEGRIFKELLEKALEEIRNKTLAINKDDSFLLSKKKLLEEMSSEHNKMMEKFQDEAVKNGFILDDLEDGGLDLFPLYKGKKVSFNDLSDLMEKGKISQTQWEITKNEYFHQVELLSLLSSDINEKNKENEYKEFELKQKFARPFIEKAFSTLLNKNYGEKIAGYIENIKADILKHIDFFMNQEIEEKKRKNVSRYQVNLFCDNSKQSGFPIIQEELPTFVNLFGTIEPCQNGRENPENGHLRLRPGALHRARGGYLILRIKDIIQEEGVWEYLKRVLLSGEIEIQSPPMSSQAASTIKPEKLSSSVKVVAIGGDQTYDILYNEDADFQKLFKINVEFDSSMERTEEAMGQYISFAETYTKKNNLLSPDDGALAKIIRYGAALSEYRKRLTTRFTKIADLLVESDFFARRMNLPRITADAVKEALSKKQYFSRLPKEKFLETVMADEVIISVSGKAVGIANGLAVLDRGYYSFGIPVAISARTAPGKKGLINVEGESGLSGEIYDKALYIIQGLLRGRYAGTNPLRLTSTICFEQSYTLVDGDSASCAELFALLSSLTGIPVRQDIAVTGSLNQMGQVQPVGGISEKIEGFFDVCNLRGLTGTQGVVIPFRNKENLVLAEKVQEAVAAGNFHIWAISNIDEGIEIMTGMNAGIADDKGRFPEGSFNFLVWKKLEEFSKYTER